MRQSSSVPETQLYCARTTTSWEQAHKSMNVLQDVREAGLFPDCLLERESASARPGEWWQRPDDGGWKPT